MILWVASFPRSGNTYLRILLNRLLGIETSTVYDVDRVAERLGRDLVGYTEPPASIEQLRRSAGTHVVKTHSARHASIADEDMAICLVRDGRDALVSWARLRAEESGTDFTTELHSIIVRPRDRGPGQWDSGSWGTNVLRWAHPPAAHRRMLRYEDLIGGPSSAVADTVAALLPGLDPALAANVPTFDELRAVDPGFFRRGIPGTHVDELPDDLEAAFWSREDNVLAMAWLRELTSRSLTGVADRATTGHRAAAGSRSAGRHDDEEHDG